jgi:hypothetical protein
VNPLTVNAGEVYLLYVSNYSQSGLSFNLTWQLTNGASLDCVVLPIELGEFDAEARPDHVALSWWTASELNNDHFNVERSTNAMDFDPIGAVPGAGTSTSTMHYEFIDHQPLIGISYYRLRQVDFDGQFTYSVTRSVHYRGHDDGVQAFPNPATDHITFRIKANEKGRCELRLLDTKGRSVRIEQRNVQAGTMDLVLSLADLVPGKYVARISGPFAEETTFVRFALVMP